MKVSALSNTNTVPWSSVLLAFATLALTIDLPCPEVVAHEFQLDGIMTSTSKRFPDKVFSFRNLIWCRGSQWAITQIWETNAGEGEMRIVRQFFDDGSNIYVLRHIEPAIAEYRPGDNSAARANSWAAQIHRSGFPVLMPETELVILFYAYASAEYLNSATNGRLYPVTFSYFNQRNDARVNAVLLRCTEEPQLPREIDFLASDGARTGTVFTASDFMPLGKAHVPRRVAVTRYATDGGEVQSYEFAARALDPKCDLTSFTPKVPTRALMSDYRFSPSDAFAPPITYHFETDWPTEERSKAHPGYRFTQQDWAAIYRDAESHRGGSALVKSRLLNIRVLLLALSVLGIGIFATVYHRHTRYGTVQKSKQ